MGVRQMVSEVDTKVRNAAVTSFASNSARQPPRNHEEHGENRLQRSARLNDEPDLGSKLSPLIHLLSSR